jgi:hypothetical protein
LLILVSENGQGLRLIHQMAREDRDPLALYHRVFLMKSGVNFLRLIVIASLSPILLIKCELKVAGQISLAEWLSSQQIPRMSAECRSGIKRDRGK